MFNFNMSYTAFNESKTSILESELKVLLLKQRHKD